MNVSPQTVLWYSANHAMLWLPNWRPKGFSGFYFAQLTYSTKTNYQSRRDASLVARTCVNFRSPIGTTVSFAALFLASHKHGALLRLGTFNTCGISDLSIL